MGWKKGSRQRRWPRSVGVRPTLLNPAHATSWTAEALESRLLLTTTNWINPSGGDFDTPSNWDNGVPTAGVDAVINIATTAPVTKSTSVTDTFASLTSSQPLVLSGGVLDVMGAVAVSNTFTLKGGTLKDATFSSTGSGALVPTTTVATLDGVTLASDVAVPSGTSLQINDGLTLNNATLTVNSGSTSGNTTLTFLNGATLGGTGGMHFSQASQYSSVAQVNLNGNLTVPSTIWIDGGGANITTAGALINQGSISANVFGQTIKVSATGTGTLQNQATMSAFNGGTLDAWALTGNIGPGFLLDNSFGSTLYLSGQNYVVNAGLSSSFGTTLRLGGTWTNGPNSTIAADKSTLILGDTQTWSNSGLISASGATVRLSGTFTAAGLGNFSQAYGTVGLYGVEDGQGSTVALTPSTGSWNLVGGTIKNATITFSGGASLVPTSTGGTLDGVTLDNNMTLPAGSSLTIKDGLTLNNAVVTIDAAGASTFTTLTFNDNALPQTLGGSGTVLFAPNSNTAYPGRLIVSGDSTTNSALTIAAGIEVHGGGGQLVAGSSGKNNGIINQGVILADVSGQSIAISGDGMDNQGTLSAMSGAVLSISPTLWTNEGTISENSSTLNLGGTFSAPASAILRSGGIVNLTGTDDLQGGTLVFTDSTGSWNFSGGTVSNATLQFMGANSLVLTSSGGTFDTVTLASNLVAPAGTGFSITTTLTLDNVVVTLESNGSINFNGYGAKAINGTGEVVLAGDPTTSNLAELFDADGSALIGPGVLIDGGYGSIVIYNSTLLNQGTISADLAGESIAISGGINNQGTLSAVNGATMSVELSHNYTGDISADGGSTLTIQGNWFNTGTISESNSTLNLGGQFTGGGMGTITRSGGTINLTGQCSEGMTLTSATGSWNLVGGDLSQGGLTCSGGAILVPTSAGGTLDGMILNSDVTVPVGASLTVVDGLTLNSANLILDGSSTLNFETNNAFYSLGASGSSAVIFAGDSASGNLANLNVSGTEPMFNDVTIRGGGGNINLPAGTDTLRNDGTIAADVDGQSININGAGWSSVGDIEALGGTLTYQGDLNLGGASVEIGIGGDTPGADCGQIQVAGDATLGGTLKAAFINGYIPTAGESFNVVTYASATGAFQNGTVTTNGASLVAAVNPTDVVLSVTGQPVTMTLSGASPNPSTSDQALTFNANVVGGVPDGETVFLQDTSNGNNVVATGTLAGGVATLMVPPGTLAGGTHNLVAAYAGDANFAPGESASYTQTVLPGINNVSPSSGPAAGGTSVTITGGGFTGATAVDFGSTPATSFTVNSTGTQITAVDPAGTSGTTVDVTVVTPGGTSATSAADEFAYLPSWLAGGIAGTWNASTKTLTVTGPAAIIADPGSDEPNIVASGSGAVVTVDPTTNPTDVHIGGITLTDGASIVMSDVDASQVADGTNASNHHSDHNVLVIGTLGATSDPTISIDSSSKLDLGDNDLIVHTGSSDQGTDDVPGYEETNELKAIEALAAEGRNVAPGGVYDGTWTGNGLTSSAAATADSPAYAGYEQNILAVEQNSDMYLGGYSSWTVGSATETLGANDIIVKYTYNGDLNLDGAVDGNAATIFSTFYDGGATSGNTYAYGDLNGDGKINGNDATIFSTVYGNGLAGSGLPQL